LLNLRGADGPLYRRVYHALKSTIRAGRLAPDARLPSTRELAADLRVSRNTVMLAYEQLLAEGYVVTRDRATTSVASALPAPAKPVSFRPQPAPPAALSAYARRLMRGLGPVPGRPRPRLRYDFRYGEPSIDEFPGEIWRRLLAARTRRPARDAFGYASPAGYAPLRAALAEYLKRARGVVCEPDQIVITNGSQQGFDLAARVLLDPGDVAVVEEPHYPGVTIPFEAAGARLARVAVDGDGLQTRRLPPALVPPFIAAKWATDRFSATLAQEVLAEFITTGQFERYLRRAGNRNAARRGALIGALRQHFGDRVEIAGENTGVHLVVWLNDVRPRDLAALIARARELGVGLYSVAPFHASPPPRAGLLFGYASL